MSKINEPPSPKGRVEDFVSPHHVSALEIEPVEFHFVRRPATNIFARIRGFFCLDITTQEELYFYGLINDFEEDPLQLLRQTLGCGSLSYIRVLSRVQHERRAISIGGVCLTHDQYAPMLLGEEVHEEGPAASVVEIPSEGLENPSNL